MLFKESARLAVSNPVLDDYSKPVTEALLSDLKISEVRAIYPMIKAINSGRLTRNYTYYPAESLMGKNKVDDPTGYASFVKPYGKPILREHQAQKVMGMMGPVEDADIPMGRVIYSGFRRHIEKKDGPRTLPSKKYVPGTVEGDGSMYIVPAITDPEAITRVLGGAYHTVSIGSRVENVTESISNQNIAQLRRDGKELPPYERGQLYEGRLSYWKMGEVRGVEVSFVNVPSDEYAGVVDPDIGVEGIRLLVAEKKSGKKNEFNFFDAKTGEEVKWEMDEFVFDESHFVDSSKVGYDIWWLNKPQEVVEEPIGTSVTESKEGEEPMTIDIEKIKEVTKDIDSALIEKLVNGDPELGYTISDTTLFQACQDEAVSSIGDWNEDAVHVACSLYLEKDGKFEKDAPLVDENAKVTVGELYGVEGEIATLETTLTHKEWKELPEDCFAGPDRTIPVTNLESAIYTLKLFSDKENVNDLVTHTLKYGVSMDEKDVFLSPLQINEGNVFHFSQIKVIEDIAPLLENVNTISESYDLDETQKEQVINFLNASKEALELDATKAPLFAYTEQSTKPVVLGTAFLLNYFVKNESLSDSRKNLVTLVGLARKLNLTQESLDSAFEAYNVFGTSVLRKFLENVPVEQKETAPAPVEKAEEEAPVVQTSVEPLPDPVAATVQTNDGASTTKESKKTPWFGLQTKPKRSGKTPVIKEKR